jgi:dTDP-glucose 4,6-dehydratase
LTDPNAFVSSNVLGTQVIINACLKHQVQKLIYVSTDEVYGHLTNEGDPSWKEDAPLNPRNPYSATKAAGELLVKAANQSHGLIYNITRSANNYGPRQTQEKLIPKTIKCILDGSKIPVYGQGLQMREWIHVADNCDGILTVLEKGKDNETYNISSNQEMHNIELVQKLCNIMEKGHDLISFVDDRPGHDFRYSVDNTKIKELGWKPSYKFKDGIANTVEWYLSNQWFLK